MKELEIKKIMSGQDIEEGKEDYPYELCDKYTDISGYVCNNGTVRGSYRISYLKSHITNNWLTCEDGYTINYAKSEFCYQYQVLLWLYQNNPTLPILSFINVPVNKVEEKRKSKGIKPENLVSGLLKNYDIEIDSNGDIIIKPIRPVEYITLNIVVTNPKDDEKKKLINAYDEAMKVMPKF